MPKSTAIGINLSSGDINTDRPTKMDTTSAEILQAQKSVTIVKLIQSYTATNLCSFTSIRCGLSPGAWVLDITVKELT